MNQTDPRAEVEALPRYGLLPDVNAGARIGTTDDGVLIERAAVLAILARPAPPSEGLREALGRIAAMTGDMPAAVNDEAGWYRIGSRRESSPTNTPPSPQPTRAPTDERGMSDLREAAQDLIDFYDGGGFRANFPEDHFVRLRAALAAAKPTPESGSGSIWICFDAREVGHEPGGTLPHQHVRQDDGATARPKSHSGVEGHDKRGRPTYFFDLVRPDLAKREAVVGHPIGDPDGGLERPKDGE